MMEKIDITTRFKMDGSLLPVEFSSGDRTIKVLDVGRQWEDTEGKHVLVMDQMGNTYHLFFQLSDLCWYRVKDIKPRSDRA